ncbi:unnamed protein product [Owenia fusiformis]|uniref:Uncharacterized protein n=1 Tax=Owenia fusiformis TaxID=6347 RepID=A0A8J1U6G4_OWEFU|nr:unnamed protein product [Owenia fusiformis]
MASKCRKFEANIFNKNKCQNCFHPKEQHSAEALESNRATRKISKCGYLFISPDYDFKNPLQRTRRWQRRFFVLYDDGELTYSVDDNVGTVPQGTLDMNKCTDVYDAEDATTHDFSVAIQLPQKIYYVKGTAKEEIQRWHDVLVMYPKSNKTKTKRAPVIPQNSKPKVTLGEVDKPKPQHAAPSVVNPQSALRNTKTQYAREFRDRSRYHTSYIPPTQSIIKPTPKDPSIFDSISPETEYKYKPRNINDTTNINNSNLVRSKSDEELVDSVEEDKDKYVKTYRGIRGLKHKSDKTYQEGLKKSNSLGNIPIEGEDQNNGNNTDWLFSALNSYSTNQNYSKPETVSRNNSDRNSDFSSRQRAYSSVDGYSNSSSQSNNRITPGLRRNERTTHIEIQDKYPYIYRPEESGESDLDTESGEEYTDEESVDEEETSEEESEGELIMSGEGSPKTLYETLNDEKDKPKKKVLKSRGSAYKEFAGLGLQPKAKHLEKFEPKNQTSAEVKPRTVKTDTPLSARVRPFSITSTSDGSPSSVSPERKLTATERLFGSKSSAGSEVNNGVRSSNETDELKMAKSSESSRTSDISPEPSDKSDESMYVKKGWLVKQGASSGEWKKHWFVLSGTALRYYSDARAEESGQLDGRIDLTACQEVAEVAVNRNYGFKLKTQNGEYTLSAMTSGIRNNWIQAIAKCVESNGSASPLITFLPTETRRATDNGEKLNGDKHKDTPKKVPPKTLPKTRSSYHDPESSVSEDDREEAKAIQRNARMLSRTASGSGDNPRSSRSILDRWSGTSSNESSGSRSRNSPVPFGDKGSASSQLRSPLESRFPQPVTNKNKNIEQGSIFSRGPIRGDDDDDVPSEVKLEAFSPQDKQTVKQLTDDVRRSSRASGSVSSETSTPEIRPKNLSQKDVEEIAKLEKQAHMRPQKSIKPIKSVSNEVSPSELKARELYEERQREIEQVREIAQRNSSADEVFDSDLDSNKTRSEDEREDLRVIEEQARKASRIGYAARDNYGDVEEDIKPTVPLSPDMLDEDDKRKVSDAQREIKQTSRHSSYMDMPSPKPEFLSKFESGKAFLEDDWFYKKHGVSKTADMVERERKRTTSRSRTSSTSSTSSLGGPYDHASTTSTPSKTPEKASPTASVGPRTSTSKTSDVTPRSKSPAHSKSPSIKVKEKARAKSPGPPRSPPPDHDAFFAQYDKPGQGNKVLNESSSTLEGQPGSGETMLVELLDAEVKTLKAQLKEARETIAVRDEEIGELKTKLENSVKCLTETEASLLSSNSQIQEEKARLNRVMESWNEREQELNDDLKTLKQQCNLKDKLITEKSEEIREIESEVSDKNTKIQKLEKDLKDFRDLETELNQTTLELNEKNELLAKFQDNDDSKVQHLEGLLKAKDMEVKNIENELTIKTALIRDKDLEIVNLKYEMEKENQQYEEESKLAEERLKKIEEDFKNDQIFLEKQVDSLTEQLNSLKKQSNMTDSLNTNMADILHEKDETISQLEEKIIELDKKAEDLVEEINVELEENSHFQTSLEKSESEKKKLFEDVEHLEEQLETLKKDNKELENTNTKLSQYYEDVRNENQQLQECLNGERNFKRDLQIEKTNLNADLDKKLKIINQLELNVEEKETTIGNLQQTMNDLRKGDNQDVRTSDITDLEIKCERAENEVKHLRADLKKAHESHDELEIEFVKLEKQCKGIENEHKSELKLMSDRVLDLTKKLADAEKTVRKLEQGANTVHAQPIIEYTNISEELHQQLSQLESKIDSVQGVILTQDSNTTQLQDQLENVEKQVVQHSLESMPRGGKGPSVKQDSELSITVDRPQLLSEIQQLKQKLSTSDEKLREITGQIMSRNDSEGKDSSVNELGNHLKEVELKLCQSQSTIEDCRQKLSNVIDDLNQYPNKMADMSEDNLEVLKSKLTDILQETETLIEQRNSSGENAWTSPTENTDSSQLQLQQFASVLVKQSVVLAQASLASEEQSSLTKSQAVEWSKAQSKIHSLESTVEKLLVENANQKFELNQHQDDFMSVYASLLAEKIVLQSEINTLVTEASSQARMNDTEVTKEDEHTVNDYANTLATKAMMHGEVTYLLDRMNTKSTETMPDILESELENSLEKLKSKEDEIEAFIEKFRVEKLDELVTNMARESSEQTIRHLSSESPQKQNMAEVLASLGSSMDSIESSESVHLSDTELAGYAAEIRRHENAKLANQLVNKELVNAEMTIIMHKYRDRFESEINQQTSVPMTRLASADKHAKIEQELQKEIQDVTSEITQKYKTVLKDHKPVKGDHHPESTDDLIDQFAEMLAHRAVLNGQVAFLTEKLNKNNTSVNQHKPLTKQDSGIDEFNPTSPPGKTQTSHASSSRQVFQNALFEEVSMNNKVAEYIEKHVKDKNSEGIVNDLRVRWPNVNDFAKQFVHETMLQAQVSYIIRKIENAHKAKLTVINDQKERLHSTVISETDPIEQIKQDYEVALLQERLDNTSAIDTLESEIHKLERLANERFSENPQIDQDIEEKYRSEIEILQETNNSLHKQLESIKDDKNNTAEHYKQIIHDLESKLSSVQSEHQRDLTDKSRRLSLLNVAEQDNYDLRSELAKLRERLHEEREQHMEAYENEIESQKVVHDEQLSRSKEEIMHLLAATDLTSQTIDEDAIRKKYEKEIDRLQSTCEKGLENMAGSQRRIVQQLRETQRREIELLRQEKDSQLAEEIKATQAALDAMKKAHEADLESERLRFQEKISDMYTKTDIDAIHQQYESEIDLIKTEIKLVSEQYSIKCIENASLQERVEAQTRTIQESRKHIHDLMARNDELNIRLRGELEELKSAKEDGSGTGDQFKDAELNQLKDELAALRDHLKATTMERDDTLHLYDSLKKEIEGSEIRDEDAEAGAALDRVSISPTRQRNTRGKMHSPDRSPSPKRTRSGDEGDSSPVRANTSSPTLQESPTAKRKVSKLKVQLRKGHESRRAARHPFDIAKTKKSGSKLYAISGVNMAERLKNFEN